MSHPTPSLSHLSSTHYQDVYEPAEDSFLLMDSLEKEKHELESLKPLICLEVGSGSGAVITFLATLLKTPAFYLSTDINHLACKYTKQTLQQNGVVHCDVIAMDLVSSLRLSGQVDVLIFNPPYVATPSDEVGNLGIEASWAGGINGREVTDRLLPCVADMLSRNGVFYLVVLPHNQPEDICRCLKSQGLEHREIMTRRAQNEKLSILKFFRVC